MKPGKLKAPASPPAGGRTSFAGAWIRTALGNAQALVMSLSSGAARRRVVRLAREFGYHHRPGLTTVLPRVSVDDVLPDLPLRIRSPVPADGNVSVLELIVLSGLVAARQPHRIFEIGTFDGRTTLNLAMNAPADAIVFTLDLPAGGPVPEQVDADDVAFIERASWRHRRFVGVVEAARIHELEGDSASFDFSPFHGSMDLVFVDGAHSYEYVISDSDAALRIAAPGATVVWHDYGEWPGVTRALNELCAADARYAGLLHVDGTSLALLTMPAGPPT